MTRSAAEEITYSTTQTAEILEVTVRTIYRWIKKDKIYYFKTLTGRYRFQQSEINRILKERKIRNLDKINEYILRTLRRKRVAYLREMQVTLEDIFLHEDTYNALRNLYKKGDINSEKKDENRWFFPKHVSWEEIEVLALYKKELMEVYTKHPRNYTRRGVIYDDYSEMFIEDALIKTGYDVVSKNAHYFHGKEYHQEDRRRPGRKRDLDYIAYMKSKDNYLGIQIKNRLEYPRMDDIHLLLDMCNVLDLIPILVTRLSHPRIYAIFNTIRGEVIQTKRYFLQPPFPRDKYNEITKNLGIPLGVYNWVPDFLLSRFTELQEKL